MAKKEVNRWEAVAKNEKRAEKIINKACKKVGYNRKSLPGKVRSFLTCLFITLAVTLVISIAGIYSLIWICVNGPSDRARYLFVTSVKESSAAGFLANLFVPDLEVNHILYSGESEEIYEDTDTDLIHIPTDNDQDSGQQGGDVGSEQEEIPNIVIEDVMGATFRGKIAIIRDPSTVKLAISGEYSETATGKYLGKIVEGENAVLGVNASGFEDEGGSGSGALPTGLVISDGQLLWGEEDKKYDIIGFDSNNILILDSMTAGEAVENGIRDAVSFGPVLIKNGKAIYKNGGVNPRTAIGQRADGAVLLLVVEGRQVASIGATLRDLTNIMLDYGAVNAANLDGGSSSSLFYDGKYVIEGSYVFGVRKIPNAFVVTEK